MQTLKVPLSRINTLNFHNTAVFHTGQFLGGLCSFHVSICQKIEGLKAAVCGQEQDGTQKGEGVALAWCKGKAGIEGC